MLGFMFLGVFSVLTMLSFYVFLWGALVVDLVSPFSGLTELHLGFLFDYISLWYFSLVSLITSVVFFYSGFYMDISSESDSVNRRFLFLLLLFVASMFLLVFSSSWVCVMLGWDGLGLVSFLLVIFYNDSSSMNSGLITVFSNRVGDCLFLISFSFMVFSGWVTMEFISLEVCVIFSAVVVCGAITKSAQLPFSSWLPAAMAAPTPVSSLVHSSTLVTAGVYLLVRFNDLLSGVYPMLMVISLSTMLLAGVCANLELDFKKVVAMSTLSQLGFMLFAISVGLWQLCYLHMAFHAFFKSVLFLSTGSLMHLILGDQDSRNFGSFSESYYSKIFFSMSGLSLMGFPFTLGFYSKDYILGAVSFSTHSVVGVLFLVSCVFTVSYSLRLLYMGFLGFPQFSSSLSFLESGLFFLPVFLLFFGCVLSGNMFSFYFLSPCVFSFWDFFVGLLIMCSGGLMFKLLVTSYYFSTSLASISFLSIISSTGVSSGLVWVPFRSESTWGEMVAAKGVKFVSSVFSMQHFFVNKYSLTMAPLVCFVLLILLL